MFSSNTSQVSDDKLWVEDVFQTWLYSGTGVSQTITNGTDLSGKGGMVWIKSRGSVSSHAIFDTSRGALFRLQSNTTGASASAANTLTQFNSNGFDLGSDGSVNSSGVNFASWTFREAPKFFDVVTYTGTGSTRSLSHNLGVTPGCIIIKKTSASGAWYTWHDGIHSTTGSSTYLALNLTDADQSFGAQWISNISNTSFDVDGGYGGTNASGETYVAYLFAHDATSDGIIQCGSFTTDASRNFSINLGWEPQWILTKASSTTSGWQIFDTMRQWTADGQGLQLLANTTQADFGPVNTGAPVATGVSKTNNGTAELASQTYIYIAIRRGPMRTPTTGTSVFTPVARSGTGAFATVSSGFVTDAVIEGNRTNTSTPTKFGVWDRLRSTNYLLTNQFNAETAATTTTIQANPWDVMDGYKVGTTAILTNASGNTFINWMLRRAPNFMDVVCYSGTGSATSLSHNLNAVPELMIIKSRNGGTSTYGWAVYHSSLGNGSGLRLETTAASASFTWWNNTTPTSTQFSVDASSIVNASGFTFVAYLFASCPGVSKVGSYTGNGSSQTINCGFSGGARFVMIKRTDSTGDWYVWDTARGIVAANDAHLSLNTNAAEVTTDDSVDTDSSGFVVNQVSATNINVSSATYIYLAIA